MLVSETVMLEFQEEWRKLDPASTYFISCHYLPTLIRALLPPLGFESGKDTPNALVNARIRRAWLPVREGRVQFQEVLFALSRLQAGQSLPDCELRQYLDKQARKHLELKEFKGAPVDWTAHEFVAAELMQASFRGFCAREELHRARQRRRGGDQQRARGGAPAQLGGVRAERRAARRGAGARGRGADALVQLDQGALPQGPGLAGAGPAR